MDIFLKYQKEMDELNIRNKSKMGDYVDIECPNCNRKRIMLGQDGKHRCEKCAWCIEEDNYDDEFSEFIRR